MIDVGALTRTYGYPAVVIGTALQGEVVLLVCGFLAHQGYLSVWIVWLLATMGGTGGDQTYFFLGRAYGEKLIDRLPRVLRGSLVAAKRLVERHPRVVLLYMRFLFGMRILLPILTGASSIPTARFIRYNVITAGVWAAVFIGMGYLYGEAAQHLLHRFEGIELILLGGLVSAGIVYHLVAGRLHQRLNRDDDA
jgi:membrane protein DedA with SNARE-associated domain